MIEKSILLEPGQSAVVVENRIGPFGLLAKIVSLVPIAPDPPLPPTITCVSEGEYIQAAATAKAPHGVWTLALTYASTTTEPRPPGYKGKWPPAATTTTLNFELIVHNHIGA